MGMLDNKLNLFNKNTEERPVVERKSKVTDAIIEKYSYSRIVEYVKESIDEILKTTMDDKGLSTEEYEKRQHRKQKLNQAQKNCVYGDVNSKQYMKDYIKDLLTKSYGLDEENINFVVNYEHQKSLSTREKFDILLHKFKDQYGYDGLSEMIDKYDLGQLKEVYGEEYYCITEDEISTIFDAEDTTLDFQDKLELLTQRIYCEYKGLGIIDEIRDMHIDGVQGGTNGLPEDFIADPYKLKKFMEKNKYKMVPKSYDSVWLFYHGKFIHLMFLSFGSYEELERVSKNIYKYLNPGQLSQAKGYMANTMADGSRVVVLRPPFAETWVFFVRKFDVPEATLEYLIQGKNSEMAIGSIKYLFKGNRNVAITGEQGTGKTMLLLAAIEHIYAIYALRIIEMFFELHVRRRFPLRNIVTMQNTDTIDGQEALDISKKTDGTISIDGEAADDKTVAWIVQTAQVASKCSIFTHHAMTFKDLIDSCRNSLLKLGIFQNEETAEKQVVKVLHFDIHLEKTMEGQRYIGRITECVPIEEEEEFPTDFRCKKTIEEKLDAFMETTLVFFRKMTRKKTCEYKNIIEYDLENDRYVVKNMLSSRHIEAIMKNLTKKDKEEFKKYLSELQRQLREGEANVC